MLERGRTEFLGRVFPAELQEIRRRREAVGLPVDRLDGPPASSQELVGLAMSGGGIRSATFTLGVLQALPDRLRRSVDYLSTVSGGGYLGSCLSSLLNSRDTRFYGDRFPLRHETGREETGAVSHLRDSSKYLAGGGLLETLRLPMLFLRGMLVNLLIFLPYIMLGVVVTDVITLSGWESARQLASAAWMAGVAFVALVVTFPFVARMFRRRFGWGARNRYELLLAASLSLCALVLMLIPLVLLTDYAVESNPAQLRGLVVRELQRPFEPVQDWWKWLVVLLALTLSLSAGRASTQIQTWGGKVIIYALGLLGPAVLFLVFLLLCVVQVYSPYVPASVGGALDRAEMSPVLTEEFRIRNIELASDAAVSVEQPGDRWRVASGDDTYRIVREDPEWLRIDGWDLWWGSETPRLLYDDRVFAGLTLFLLLFNWLLLDVNITSVHGFYRDRLSRAYLLTRDATGALVQNDTQKLSTLASDGSAAPYHLINVALNLEGSDDRSLRGRRADFFCFSKRFTGGLRTGFCETAVLEQIDSHLDLGTAMAISGAAAAPNMGTTTVKPLVFILTLLNIRLGYWLPNPGAIDRPSWLKRLWLRVGAGPRYLLKESVGRLDERGTHINVSDGGHIENLAIYELLRRRCKYIVAIDGEADPDLRFHGLITLMRYAQIDMGIEIDVDLSKIRRGEDSRSARHWTVATIDYGGGEIGHLLYVKSSLSGDENDCVRDYAFWDPAFPHQSTADQFFDEAQFEAYRALGYHIGCQLFRDTDPDNRTMRAPFDALVGREVDALAENTAVTA